jgi:dolichol kinase
MIKSKSQPTFKAMEYARGMVHTSLGLILVSILNLFPRFFALMVMIIGTAAVLIVEYLRLRNPRLQKWLHTRLAIFMREEEDSGLTGASYFLVGSLITAVVFPVNIASLAIIFLAFGDPSAATIGRWRGYTRPWNKHVEGNLAFLLISMAAGILSMHLLGTPNIIVVIIGAFFAALIHTLPLPRRFNDNMTIPIGSALVMSITSFVLTF